MSIISASSLQIVPLHSISNIREKQHKHKLIMDINDLSTLKALGGAMTPYEQMMIGYRQNKSHTSGVGVAGLVLGTVGTAAAVGAWIFAPLFASAKCSQAKEAARGAKELAATQYGAALQLMNAQNANVNATLDRLIGTVAAERAERLQGQTTISQTITDTISGQQSASQNQTTSVDNAVSQIMSQTFADAVTGRSSLNATPVQIYSAPQPCGCPGCGCNGGY